jgi:hypothetical protein
VDFREMRDPGTPYHRIGGDLLAVVARPVSLVLVSALLRQRRENASHLQGASSRYVDCTRWRCELLTLYMSTMRAASDVSLAIRTPDRYCGVVLALVQ